MTHPQRGPRSEGNSGKACSRRYRISALDYVAKEEVQFILTGGEVEKYTRSKKEVAHSSFRHEDPWGEEASNKHQPESDEGQSKREIKHGKSGGG